MGEELKPSFLHYDIAPHIEYKGREIPLAGCDCKSCGNLFFVPNKPEHQPVYCVYCGIKFIYYDSDDGIIRDMGGKPL